MVLRASLHYGTHAAYLYKEDLSSTRILDKWHQIALCKPSNTASDTSRSFEERNILLFLKHLWSQKKCKIYLWSALVGSRPLPTCLFQVFSPTGKGEYESTFADSLLRLISRLQTPSLRLDSIGLQTFGEPCVVRMFLRFLGGRVWKIYPAIGLGDNCQWLSVSGDNCQRKLSELWKNCKILQLFATKL